MAITTLKVPEITNNFGKVNKIIWFDVPPDIEGTFSINLYITPSQSLDTTITVFNHTTNKEHFSKTYPKSSNNGIINETIKIKHTPGLNSPIYGLKTI
jgi:hypothetical protein